MKVLIVMTGASELRLLDRTKHRSGFWAEEFRGSLRALRLGTV